MFRIAVLTLCLAAGAGCRKSSPPTSPPAEEGSSTSRPAALLRPAVQNGLWGYIDPTGRFAIPPQFQQAEAFSESLAAVQQAGAWEFIDSTGRRTFPSRFEEVDRAGFSNGRVAVMQGGKWGLLDIMGRMVLPPRRRRPLRFGENLAPFRRKDRYGYLAPDGQVAIEPQFAFAGRFSEGLAAVLTEGRRIGRRIHGGRWGYIDKTGTTRIPPQFLAAGEFSEGLAWVRFPTRGRSRRNAPPLAGGYIDPQGRPIIRTTEYSAGRPFSEGLAAVQRRHTGLWGYIDKTGQVVIGSEFDLAREFREQRAAVLTLPDRGGGLKWGYLAPDGRMVIPPQFDRAGDFQEGLAAVWIGEKLGYIDREGHWIRPPTE